MQLYYQQGSSVPSQPLRQEVGTDLLPLTWHHQQKYLACSHSRQASSSLADFSCISWKPNRGRCQSAGSNQAQDMLRRDAFECACTAASGNQQQTSKAITLALRIGALRIRNPLAFLPRWLLSEASETRVRYDFHLSYEEAEQGLGTLRHSVGHLRIFPAYTL